MHSFSTDYILPPDEDKLAKDVFTLTAATKKSQAEPIQKTSEVSKPLLLDANEMMRSDDECAQRGPLKLVFREFEAVQQRSEFCRKAGKGDVIWRWQPTQHLKVIKDKMWYVRNLVAQLVKNNLVRQAFTGEDVKAELQKSLRRVWGLLALTYGCYSEVGLLCTVMDRLLEDLAALFVGHVDPKMETVAMQHVVAAIAKDYQGASPKLVNFMETDAILEGHHRARLVFSEIARFYRGSIVLAVSKVSATYHHSASDQKTIWYENLLKFFDECSHPSCREQLKVSRMQWGKTQDDSKSGKGKKSQSKRAKGADKSKEPVIEQAVEGKKK